MDVTRIELQHRLIDFNRTCASEVVVDAGIFTIVVQDTAESCRIVIRTGICRLTILLAICVVTTCSNGNLVSIDVIAIDKVRMILICCPRDVRVAIGLGSRTTDIGITSEDFKRTIRCCNGIAFFASQILSLCVDNKVRTRIIAARSTNVTIHTSLFFRSALTRKRDFTRIASFQVAFLESRFESIIQNAVLNIIAAREGSRCRRRILGYISRITIDFALIIGFDCNCRLYLENVLVTVMRGSILIKAVGAVGVCMPAGRRLAVEVCAEIVAVWRCGIDFPVATFAGRDGLLCLCCICRVMEGTFCAACIDDNGIACRRLSNQCAATFSIIRQSDRAVPRRISRDQTNLIAILDAMDRDIVRRFDGNKAIRCNLAIDSNIFICSRRGNLNLFVCGNLTNIHIALRGNLDVAICKACSGIRMIIMDINGAKDFDIACRRLDGQVAQARAFAAAQASCIRHTFRTYGYIACTAIDGKCRVRQFCFTDKAMDCVCSIPYIVPAILVCPTNSNIGLMFAASIIIWLIIRTFPRITRINRLITHPIRIVAVELVSPTFPCRLIECSAFLWSSEPSKHTSICPVCSFSYTSGYIFAAGKILHNIACLLDSIGHGS